MTTKQRPEDAVIQVPFTAEAFRDVKAIAEREGKPLSRVIQESIAVKKWVSDVQKQGGEVYGVRRGQRARLDIK